MPLTKGNPLNTGATAPEVEVEGTITKVPTTRKPASEGSKFTQEGKARFASLSEEEKVLAGSKSGTLHVDTILGLYNQDKRAVSKDQRVTCNKMIGFECHSDEPIQVPVIDPAKGDPRLKWTPVDPSEIAYKNVAAGETFQVTFLEMVYLINRIEYSGLAEFQGNPRGFGILVKANKWATGESAVPCISFGLAQGSIKEVTVAIDEPDAQGNKVINERYAEKFSYFLQKKSAPRGTTGGAKKSDTPVQIVNSAQIRSILGI